MKRIVFYALSIPMFILMAAAAVVSSMSEGFIELLHRYEGWSRDLHKSGMYYVGSGIWTSRKPDPVRRDVHLHVVKPTPTMRNFQRGDRVVVRRDAGFSRGSHGVVEFVEPTVQEHVWVLRDGASGPMYFIGVNECDSELQFETPPTTSGASLTTG